MCKRMLGAMPKQLKYDVAISLRWTDVDHAHGLYEALRDRLKVFFADEKQEEIAGTDGEETFGYVFRDQARVVVVFYRPDWGETPFTRAEESAIKQRAYHEGYGFSIWVPMTENKEVPPYLPPQQIWFDFSEYGISGLAAVVEKKVRESGAKVREKSPIDKLQSLSRRYEAKRKREDFVKSGEAIEIFMRDVKRIQDLVEAQLERVNEAFPHFRFGADFDKFNKYEKSIAIFSPRGRGLLRYHRKYADATIGSYLKWSLQKQSRNSRTGGFALESYKGKTYELSLNDSGSPAWHEKKTGKYASIEEVVEEAVTAVAIHAARRTLE